MGYAMVPEKLARDRTVGLAAKVVYMALASYADREGDCWPSLATLAGVTGMDRGDVSRSIKRLEGLGYVRAERQTGRLSRYRLLSSAQQSEEQLLGSSQQTVGLIPTPLLGSSQHDPKYPNGSIPKKDHNEATPSKSPPLTSVESDLIRPLEEHLRGLKGYAPSPGFYRKVLANYGELDLEEEAIKMAGWLRTKPGRQCSTAFVLNWLKRQKEEARGEDRQAHGARNGHSPGGPRGPSTEDAPGVASPFAKYCVR